MLSYKNLSVRKAGTVINVRVYECLNNREKMFEGEARVNNEREMEELLNTLELKGFIKRNRSWW